jgi:hypothetical protein
MSTLSIKSRNTKSAAPKKGSAQSKTASRRKVTSPAANAKTPSKADGPKVERVTKQERVLTLLSQREGASIEGYYNRQRLHSALGYITPEQAERQAA